MFNSRKRNPKQVAAQFNIDLFEVIDEDKQIYYERSDLTLQDTTLIKVLKGDIPNEVVTKVQEAMQVFWLAARASKHAREDINDWSFHVGIWTTQGGRGIVPTANSLSIGKSGVPGIEAFRTALEKSGLIMIVDQLMKNHFPNMARAYKIWQIPRVSDQNKKILKNLFCYENNVF